MNCHARWGGTLPAPHPPADAVLDREDAFPFTPSELERLEIYRRAVAAGFYAD